MSTARVLRNTVTVTVTDEAPIPALFGTDEADAIDETVVEVSITSGKHVGYLVNAAALAADYGLRGALEDHPAGQTRQCGGTEVHAPHGACPGLDGTEVGNGWVSQLASDNARLRSGLHVIAARGCYRTPGDGDCWTYGRTATGAGIETDDGHVHRACEVCVANKVLAGEPLPTVPEATPRGTDRG